MVDGNSVRFVIRLHRCTHQYPTAAQATNMDNPANVQIATKPTSQALFEKRLMGQST